MITKGKIVWHFIKIFQLVLLRNVLEIWKLQCTYVCVWILGLKRSIFFSFLIVKDSVKENEVPTEKNSSRASIFATKASYISN